MRVPRKNFVIALLSLATVFLSWKVWSLHGSAIWTGFISFQADTLRQTVKQKSDVDAVIHQLNFYLVYHKAHVGSVRQRFLLGVVDREKRHLVAETIDYLKEQTQEDLGDDPEPWIRKYLDQ